MPEWQNKDIKSKNNNVERTGYLKIELITSEFFDLPKNI